MRYQTEDLRIETHATKGALVLRWEGRSEGRDPAAALKPVMEAVGPDFDQATLVEFDFRGVDYMNSSTIRPILVFVQAASARAKNVRVRYDGTKNWQRLSFLAIGAVLGTLGNVELSA